MPLAANTRITLALDAAKKDAIVATPGDTAKANEVALYAAATVDLSTPQSLMGTFINLRDFALSHMELLTGLEAADAPDVLHMPLGGGDNDIVVNGTPGTDDVRLEVGIGIGPSGRSHFLDRTFKLLAERWMEESKSGLV